MNPLMCDRATFTQGLKSVLFASKPPTSTTVGKRSTYGDSISGRVRATVVDDRLWLEAVNGKLLIRYCGVLLHTHVGQEIEESELIASEDAWKAALGVVTKLPRHLDRFEILRDPEQDTWTIDGGMNRLAIPRLDKCWPGSNELLKACAKAINGHNGAHVRLDPLYVEDIARSVQALGIQAGAVEIQTGKTQTDIVRFKCSDPDWVALLGPVRWE
jgi:hypothetical protein